MIAAFALLMLGYIWSLEFFVFARISACFPALCKTPTLVSPKKLQISKSITASDQIQHPRASWFLTDTPWKKNRVKSLNLFFVFPCLAYRQTMSYWNSANSKIIPQGDGTAVKPPAAGWSVSSRVQASETCASMPSLQQKPLILGQTSKAANTVSLHLLFAAPPLQLTKHEISNYQLNYIQHTATSFCE